MWLVFVNNLKLNKNMTGFSVQLIIVIEILNLFEIDLSLKMAVRMDSFLLTTCLLASSCFMYM